MEIDKEILFAEWIAENHYRLINVIQSVHIWANEHNTYSTKELFEIFKKEICL